MNKFSAFHTTVRGHLHVQKETPCEDSSASYSDCAGNYHIAVIADGHGDTACFRSKFGSQVAVNVALKSLQTFADAVITSLKTDMPITQKLAIPKYKRQVIKQLTDSIVSKWSQLVNEDLEVNPPTEEEIKESGRYAADYLAGNRLDHIYGTTLMAGLLVANQLILIHQGDGRCDVIYKDGSIDQPIPWDDRCFENVTTSMCDEDAAEGIRHCVINLDEHEVVACYLGSDGVEDSFSDMEGTHMFYRNLSSEFVSRELKDFSDYLEKMLPDFSRAGSGDDVSVAGIVNKTALQDLADSFKISAQKYQLSQQLEQYEKKLSQMPRKHGILKRRMEDAKRQMDICVAKESACTVTLAILEKDYLELQEELSEAEADWIESKKNSSDIQDYIENPNQDEAGEPSEFVLKLKMMLPDALYMIQQNILVLCDSKQKRCETLRVSLTDKEEEIFRQKKMLAKAVDETITATDKFEDANNEFQEYNQQFIAIQTERDKLSDMINHVYTLSQSEIDLLTSLLKRLDL